MARFLLDSRAQVDKVPAKLVGCRRQSETFRNFRCACGFGSLMIVAGADEGWLYPVAASSSAAIL